MQLLPLGLPLWIILPNFHPQHTTQRARMEYPVGWTQIISPLSSCQGLVRMELDPISFQHGRQSTTFLQELHRRDLYRGGVFRYWAFPQMVNTPLKVINILCTELTVMSLNHADLSEFKCLWVGLMRTYRPKEHIHCVLRERRMNYPYLKEIYCKSPRAFPRKIPIVSCC